MIPSHTFFSPISHAGNKGTRSPRPSACLQLTARTRERRRTASSTTTIIHKKKRLDHTKEPRQSRAAAPTHFTSPQLTRQMEILHHVAGLYHSISHIQHTLSTAHEEIMTSAFERATETAEFLRSKLPGHLARPRVAVVCGSGLGGLAKTVNPGTEVWEYKDVPNFPLSTGERVVPSCLL